MRPHRLKTLRRVASLAFFLLIALVFLDFRNMMAPSLAGTILYLQFVPSLLQFAGAATLGTAGCLVIVLLTVFCGRVYCSSLCPLGTFQDIVTFMAGKAGKRSAFSFSPPHAILRHALLLLTVLALVAGSGFLLNLLDPFSSFGRIFAHLVRPVVLLVNNVSAVLLEQFGMYSLARVRWPVFASVSFAFAVATLMLVAWLAATRGRLYCNTICPVGALLGLFARISLLRIAVDPASCTGCGSCVKACKACCIDDQRMTVDSSRCVSCCNCLAVCPTGAMRFDYRRRGHGAALPPDGGRRRFLLNSGVFLLGLTGVAEDPKSVLQSKPTTIPERITHPVSPPGSGSIARFTAACTACHLCVSSCPSRVLVPALFEFGLGGLMQPRMNFRAGHCTYDCTICMDVCPSGAIRPLPVEEKKLTQIGVAQFIKENCVVHTDRTACGACSEHCPTKAVDMVPYANPAHMLLKIPEMKPEYCIGCGGCEHACPTTPYKAIYVDGNPSHRLARKPVVKKIDVNLAPDDDFPF